MTNPDLMPTTLSPIVEAIGPEAAAILVDRYGGTSISARRPELASVIGPEAAARLAAAFAGERLDIPRARRWLASLRDAEISARHDAGETHAELALRFRLTDRRIRGILAGLRDNHEGQTLTATLRATDCINHDGTVYQRGDLLPEMPPTAAEALLASGVAQPAELAFDAGPSVPPRETWVRHDRAALRYVDSPSLEEWLGLLDQITSMQRAVPLSDRAAEHATETWAKLDDRQRSDHWHGVVDDIVTLHQRRADAPRAFVT